MVYNQFASLARVGKVAGMQSSAGVARNCVAAMAPAARIALRPDVGGSTVQTAAAGSVLVENTPVVNSGLSVGTRTVLMVGDLGLQRRRTFSMRPGSFQQKVSVVRVGSDFLGSIVTAWLAVH